MAFQYVLPHAVTSQLDSLRRRIRRVAFLRGCGLFLTLSCGLLIGTLLIDFLFDLQTGPRLAGFVVFCVAEVVLLGFLLVRPLVIRLTDPEVASLAEEKFPELGERVSSLVELADPDVPDAEKGSPLMRDLLEEETLEALARCDFDRSVSVRPAVRRLSYGFGTLSFLVLSLLIFPSVSSLLLARLFNPWGNYESVSRLLFEIEGADEFVARGDDLQIVAKLTWRNGSDDPVPEPVQLSWHSEDGNSDVRTLRFDPDRDAFTTAIPDVQDSLEFFVSSEGNRSRRYRINVLDRPEVLAAKLEISPPGYLGQPRETLDGVTGEIAVFEHSRLTFDLTFSQPVDEAAINWLSAMVLPDSEAAGDQQVVPLNEEGKETADELRKPGTTSNLLVTVDDLPATQLVVAEDGLSARLQIPATIQGAFAFVLKESHGLENDSEPFRQLIIRRDQPPVLEVPGGEQDRAKPTDVYGIRVSAVDDVALEELELHVSSREGLNKVIKAPSELLGRESLEHEFRIDLSDIAVKSGDFLKLQIRAADGRPTPSANEVWSKVRYVAISDDASAQGTNDVLARQEQIRKELQDIRDQLRKAVEQSDDLRDDAQRSLDDDRKFAQQQAVENLAGREEELAARMAELANQFSEHPLFANLSENLWRMAADELDPAAVKLAESSQQKRKDRVAMLNENSAVADMVEEGLANVAAEFEKLADLEEDLLELNRISQRANQLADDARQLEQLRKEIASKTPDAAEPLDSDAAQRHEEVRQELAENQQLLMEEQSELMAALDHLMQQRPELLEAARDHQLGKLAGLARQASEVARPQELLAESLKKDAELARQTAESIAKPEDQNSEVEPTAEPLTKAGSLPAEQNSTEQNSTGQTPVTEPGNSAADVAVSEENDPVGHPPNSEPVASPQTSPSIGELLAQQEELTAQAARLALQTAREAGTDSPATRYAAESAQQSEQAEAAARGGQFAQAASEAADAQQTAAATAEALQESAPELAEQAQQLAVQQQQMADAFEQLENSPSQRAAAQQEQQRRLAAQADQIAQALDELAEQLGSQPLDLQQQGQQASSAQQSAQQGQQSASQAAQNMQAGRRDQAAQAAQQAADSLRESAQQAAADSPRPNSNSPVPGEFAAQISDAMRQLQNAQERLAQAAAETPQASQTSGEPGETSAEVASGNSEPGTTALDATTGETATAQHPSGDSPDGEPAQRPPSQGVPAEQADETPSLDNAVSDSQPGQQSGQPTPGTPGSKRQPGSSPGNQPGQQTQQRNGALAEAADALQQAAEMLSDAAQQLAADGSQSGDNQGQSNQQPSSQQPGLGNSGTGAFADGEMKGPLDTELKRRAMKNWGQLPGNLKTEILQSSQRKANGDYAKLIKLYFDELAKAGQGDGKK